MAGSLQFLQNPQATPAFWHVRALHWQSFTCLGFALQGAPGQPTRDEDINWAAVTASLGLTEEQIVCIAQAYERFVSWKTQLGQERRAVLEELFALQQREAVPCSTVRICSCCPCVHRVLQAAGWAAHMK